MNATEQTLDYQPLLPSLSHLSFLDLLLPPLAIALSLLLHILLNPAPVAPGGVRAHIYRAKTAHARFLPSVARHVFSYPVLFFGVDLEALEHGELDLGDRWFAWNPARWTLTALRPEGYLDPSPGSIGIRERLVRHLAKHDVGPDDARVVYTVTMPAYLGMEGINPLTTHFCYASERAGGLKAVVLEVHNTFGERHLYVLRVGVNEDPQPGAGYEHQWTFPRAFHVSPFNDRSGFYRVSLSDPLLSSSSDSSPSTAFPTHPSLSIKIVFLTPTLAKKIYASLSGPGEPLAPSSLLSSLLRWPFSLLLTTPRILYQATKLHYAKRLDVFPRPEPLFPLAPDARASLNPVERGGKPGGVGWQPPGSTELLAKKRTLEFLHTRVRELRMTGRRLRVVLVPADLTQPTLSIPTADEVLLEPEEERLEVTYLTPVFFIDLLMSPSVPLALSLGSHRERRWFTSSDSLFLSTFTSSLPLSSQPAASRLARLVRHKQMEWSMSFASNPSRSGPPPPPHPLDDQASFRLVWSLWSYCLGVRMGYWIFVVTRARFVRGTEGWSEWARWASGKDDAELVSAEIVHGSVLRPHP